MSSEWWQFGIAIIGSIGIGTIISSYIAVHFQKRKLLFETKLVKYSNLIEAYHNNFVSQDQAGHQHFVSQLKQVELLGSAKIISMCQKLQTNSNDDDTRDKLIKAMNLDLRSYTSSSICSDCSSSNDS